ncbi:MAG: sulfotransferase [Thermodesulfobacteriota bacterium]
MKLIELKEKSQKNDNQFATVIYIAGYGRSGSTILDIMLGDHPEIFSGGELAYLLDDYFNDARNCTCGKKYCDCDIWGGLQKQLTFSVESCAKKMREIDQKFFLRGVKNTWNETDFDEYAQIVRTVFHAACCDKKARFIVDSSKTAGDSRQRPIALSRVAGLNVKVIHLKRSFLQTIRSVMRKSNWEAEGHNKHNKHKIIRVLRAVPGWIIANTYAWRTKMLLKSGSYYRLAYEDLLAEPRKKFEEIGQFLGVDLSEIGLKAENGSRFTGHHNVGGNRLRLQKEIAFKKI